MECYESNKKLVDYCESCLILVNFSHDLHRVIQKYINDGGDISNLEAFSVDVMIPILREACSNWALNITDEELHHKKNNIDFMGDRVIEALITSLPYNLNERKDFINQQTGLATVQITRINWFQKVFNNILKSLK